LTEEPRDSETPDTPEAADASEDPRVGDANESSTAESASSSDAPTASGSDEPEAAEEPSEPSAAPAAEAQEPVAAEAAPAAEAPVEAPPTAEEVVEQVSAEAQPAVTQATAPQHAEVDEEDLAEQAQRVKPAIPGADLIPDIVPEGDEFLDAEARAAAEAEAEEAARRAADDADQDDTQPIADAAIDLAAGARYTATGKRKSGVARVILKPGTGTYIINGRSLEEFFPRATLQRNIRQPLEAVGYDTRMDVVARMHGGGVSAQAGALRHGISRALIAADPNLRGELKRRGFLTRDPRVKERKKAGLKKARKRPQFSKR
jgi:small subunit ribosomal protein S9